MRPAEFWCSTLPEIRVFLDGSRLAQRDARDLVMVGAWWTEAYARHEKLPELADVLSGKKRRRETREETISKWKGFFARQRPPGPQERSGE